jgi:hypothetical protein
VIGGRRSESFRKCDLVGALQVADSLVAARVVALVLATSSTGIRFQLLDAGLERIDLTRLRKAEALGFLSKCLQGAGASVLRRSDDLRAGISVEAESEPTTISARTLFSSARVTSVSSVAALSAS